MRSRGCVGVVGAVGIVLGAACSFSPDFSKAVPDTCNPAGGYCAGLGVCGRGYRVDEGLSCAEILDSCCMPLGCVDAGGSCGTSAACKGGVVTSLPCAQSGEVCCLPPLDEDGGLTTVVDGGGGDGARVTD